MPELRAEYAASPPAMRRRLRAFLAFCALALPGALASLLPLPGLLDHAAGGKPLPMPLHTIEAIVFTQTFVLLVVLALAGCFAAPACGLRSRVYEWAAGLPRSGRIPVARAIVTGIVLFAFGAVVDQVLVPYYGAAWNALKGLMPSRTTALAVGVLYGGIDEEILLRWGVMSVLAWLGWKAFARKSPAPPRSVVVAAIVLSALVFGAGHLPAVIAMVPSIPPILIVRTLLINAVAGCALGWLFWRHNLETAMLAHATFHVTLFVASPFLA